MLPARVEARIRRTPRRWQWLGSANQDGYGNAWINGRLVRAHRAVYESVRGPIPEGLTLDHLCGVRDCVNPAHLEPVSLRENILRGDCSAARNARKTHCETHGIPLEKTTEQRRRCPVCRKESRRRYALTHA